MKFHQPHNIKTSTLSPLIPNAIKFSINIIVINILDGVAEKLRNICIPLRCYLSPKNKLLKEESAIKSNQEQTLFIN